LQGAPWPSLFVAHQKQLPQSLSIAAAQKATEINPLNHPQVQHWAALAPNFPPTVERIAVLTTKFCQTNGVRLTVSFLDNPPNDLRARIIQHMNAWGTRCNVKFTETNSGGQVRIARTPGSGYWSYLGIDILSIAADQPTMNLESFTMQTPESEYHRVVRHETGHTLGCPHEHMRAELVNKIDPDKAIAFFGQTQGWTPDEVRQQDRGRHDARHRARGRQFHHVLPNPRHHHQRRQADHRRPRHRREGF
jgi:hypothetical protein